MIKSIINSSVAGADVVFIGADNEISSSFGRGAKEGPSAVRACLDSQVEFREARTGLNAALKLKIAWRDLGDLNGTRDSAALDRAVTSVCGAVGDTLNVGAFPFVIGGDHSNAIGAIMAVGSRFGPDEMAIVHIGAHHDLRFDDGDCNDPPYGRMAHCCALRPTADVGYEIVQVGIRAVSDEEHAYAASHPRIAVFPWGYRRDFRPPQITEILKVVCRTKVYLTIDVDGFDPAFMPATGAPVSGGLGWYYGLDLIQALCGMKQIVGADICEVAPRPHDQLTQFNAAQLAYDIVTWSVAAKRR